MKFFSSFCHIACVVFFFSAIASARPNILMIVSEDNGPELGCNGEPRVRTPVLDRLAAQGVRFNRAFVPQDYAEIYDRAGIIT